MRQRIALILAAALALGGAALIPGAHLFLTGQEEAVTVKEEILYGEAAAAQGLHVTLGVESGVGGTDLLWDTAFTPGETAAASTDFTALPWGQHQEMTEEEELLVRFASPSLVYAGPTDDANFWQPQARNGRLYLPAQDVAERTGPGEERRETLDLADYYDVYPVHLSAFFNHFYNSNYTGMEQLTEFFRIPVPEGTMMEVTVSRNEEGLLEDASCRGETGLPKIEVPLFTDGYAYLFFDPTGGGKAVDVSQIAGGYGLFRLDYHFSYDPAPWMTLDSVETVLPVEGIVRGVTVWEGELLVFSEEEGTLWMSVLDAEGGEVKQRLELLPVTGETPFYEAVSLDRGILIWLVGGQAAVAEKDGGSWRADLTGDLSDAALVPYFSDGAHDDDRWYSSAAAFDGERLAVLYTLPSRETTSLPDVGLTVLDHTGTPVFAARYRRSGHFDQSSRGLLSYSPGRYHWTEDPSAILAFS